MLAAIPEIRQGIYMIALTVFENPGPTLLMTCAKKKLSSTISTTTQAVSRKTFRKESTNSSVDSICI